MTTREAGEQAGPPDRGDRSRRGRAAAWLLRAAALAGLLLVGWVCLGAAGAVRHGHPLYVLLLTGTVLLCLAIVVRVRARTPRRGGWRRVLRGAGVLALALWLVLLGWLRPFGAVEPALTAMESTAAVSVDESWTEIVMTPTGPTQGVGLFFQPGARVDARAYAAVLRPVAEAGHVVVIAKQPLGIGFLALGAFDDVPAAHPGVRSWVLGGHSLGGTVAAIQASGAAPQEVAGLLLHASYPAGDITGLDRPVLTVSGDQDGLATPDQVAAASPDLPPGAVSVQLDGVVHAFFGDYGDQPGDGTPGIDRDRARAEISRLTVGFVQDPSAASMG